MSEERSNPRPEVADERLRRWSEADAGRYVAPEAGAGDILVWADLAGTVVFVATAVAAAAFFTTGWQWVGAITALVLFTIGVFAFLWAYYNAVQRSRVEEISVMQLYFLLGPPTPSRVRVLMLSALAVQVLTALATALARPNGADGNPGTSLALGFLVPMFGFGLNGLWAAYHGRFPLRERRPGAGSEDEVVPE